MKKLIVLVLILVCVLNMNGCTNKPIDTTKPVFETENISSITLFSVPDHEDGIEVPSEYMEEITAWIGTFTIDKEAGEYLEPGANTCSFRIQYLDGTIVESGVNAITIDGVTYYMKSDKEPDGFRAIFANAEP